jgi:peptidoglycan hydrolase-like protein with peptidoglycan-binding domain
MNPRTLAFAVCCLAAVGLAGCGSEPKAPAPPPPVPVPVATPAPPPPSAMPTGLTTAQQRVAKVQTALNANGAQLDVDGKMGAKTRDALKAYQSAHQLKPTGHPDAATLKSLGG